MNHIYNYNDINKMIGKSKIAKVFGWIFIIAGILMCIITVSEYFSWNLKKENYDKQYVYSSNGNLSYEINDNKIYVEKIYNTNDEVIELEIPDKKTIIMYCDKNNIKECIYIDLNNSNDSTILNPVINIVVILIILGLGIFFSSKKRTKIDANGEEKTTFTPICVFSLSLFIVGALVITLQIYNTITYFKLKNYNNITIATIYSDIYTGTNKKQTYKTVSYYYVDNQKYIYENDVYVNKKDEGPLEEKLGTTFELYYDENDPSKVIKKDEPVEPLLIFWGIVLIAISTPFVFFKTKLEKRYDKMTENPDRIPWEI